MSENLEAGNSGFSRFLWTITGLGVLAFIYAALRLDFHKLNSTFAVVVALALIVSSRIIVPIPRLSSQISISDTFVFLILLLYGSEAAIVVAAIEAVLSSFRFNRKYTTVSFNSGCAAISVFITGTVLNAFFGDTVSLLAPGNSARLVGAVCTMAFVHYVSNTGIVAIGAALKTNQSIWPTWRKHYLWASITYFAGAIAAAVIATLVRIVGFYALVIPLPLIGIVFITYRTYLQNIESSAAQADQAERHVKELSHYIAEQERIQEQFSQMEKLSALGELASGVAHDFNNTLAGILGRAQLLQRTNDPEKLKRGLQIIIKTAEDGAKTVKRIQDFARQRRDHDFELVSVDQILTDASEITRPRWKNSAEASNVHINLEMQIRSQAKVMGDASELREVLVNMVFNAIDAMPAGGTLSLSVRNIADSVVIAVADTGVGMDAEIRSRIFDPFFTTKGKAGMGLGLAVSFGIIRRHGGTIEVDSQPGRGSEFRLVLPIAIVEANVGLHEIASPQIHCGEDGPMLCDPAPEQTKVLVVDDEEFVRELLQEILESEGCNVHVAENGNQALELFARIQFDGVFTDVGMPGMSGWELAQAIRERSQDVPIAVITGWGEAVGSDEQKEARVNWVVAKPFSADRISDLVKEIKAQRETTERLDDLSIVAA